MTDIVIYTTPEKLEHKRGLLKDDPDSSYAGEYCWTLPNRPKKWARSFYEDDFYGKEKVYFATKGFVRGYFIFDSVDDEDTFEFTFQADSWKDIKPIPTKHFQGFKYKWWKDE